MSLLKAQKLSVIIGKTALVQGVDLEVRRGEILAIIGPNGAGKTSLLKGLAGLLPAVSGQVFLQDKPLKTFSIKQKAQLMAYVPQSPPCHWQLSVKDMVALGRLPHHSSFEADAAAIEQAMRACDVQQFAQRPLVSLSGGEQARVHLARALCGQAQVLLADEPVSALDPYHQFAMMERLQDLAQQGMGIVVVLHDLALAARYASRIAVMQNGQMLVCDHPDAVFEVDFMARIFGIEIVRSAQNHVQVIGLAPK